MKAHQLKNAILQLAVQGKLVPQNPNDEPACKLLERIRAEKKRRIKAGEIKKDKRDSTIVRRGTSFYEIANGAERCIDDELPFDLPKGWEWITLTDIGFFSSGKTPASQLLEKSGIIPYFKVADMNTLGNEVYLHKTDSYLNNSTSIKLFQKDSVVFPKNGGAVFTNKKRILLQDSLVDLNTGCFTSLFPIDVKFLYYLFSTIDFKKHYKGTALPTVDLDSVKCLIWGLPPLAEQRRIVDRIESLLPLVEAYGKAEAELSELDARFPEALKKSILQEAVQGKLVPQDPNDEPASVLLERIRAEKERLIKEGKIKKDKHESVIFRRDNSHYENLDGVERCIDGEIPFEIPDSWKWVRHNDLFEISGGSQPPKSKFISEARDGYIRLYQIRDYGNTPVPVYIPISAASKISHKGDILLARYGASLGKVFWAEDGAYNVAMARVIPQYKTELISKKFLFLFYQSSLYQSVIHANSRSAQAGFNKEDLSSLLFPLPPLAEQHRIVQRIEELLPLVKGL